jgi:septal ring factor EnvC (AmiA/AmiB activator)
VNLEAHQVARLQEKLSLRESTINALSKTLDSKEKELQNSAAQSSTLKERVSSLCQDVHRFRIRCARAEEAHSHAVEKAVDRARKQFESRNSKRIKRPDGRIEDPSVDCRRGCNSITAITRT